MVDPGETQYEQPYPSRWMLNQRWRLTTQRQRHARDCTSAHRQRDQWRQKLVDRGVSCRPSEGDRRMRLASLVCCRHRKRHLLRGDGRDGAGESAYVPPPSPNCHTCTPSVTWIVSSRQDRARRCTSRPRLLRMGGGVQYGHLRCCGDGSLCTEFNGNVAHESLQISRQRRTPGVTQSRPTTALPFVQAARARLHVICM